MAKIILKSRYLKTGSKLHSEHLIKYIALREGCLLYTSLSKLYARFGITDSTDYGTKKPSDFPIMEDFYKLCEEEFYSYDSKRKYLYTEETLQEVCLGIHSMCVGAESKYFNGHTNITDDEFLVFGVKGLLDTNKRLKDAMLFNILSFMSNQLLGKGNTAAAIDELYMYLTTTKNANGVTNNTAIEYIRNAMKRVRKKDSAIVIASQNINDFLMPEVCELTKPLFAIPTHQFLSLIHIYAVLDYVGMYQNEGMDMGGMNLS